MADFDWLGNELCLDFHNTSAWGEDGAAGEERLPDFGTLLAWCRAAGTADPATLETIAERTDAVAHDEILVQAHNLRAVLHDVFAAVAAGDLPAQVNMEELNDFLASVLMRVEWELGADPALSSSAAGGLSELLAPVVWSAAALLVSPFRDKVRACPSASCGRLFVDLSRRGNRRWCDMGGCGNRAKASRHYARRRASSNE